MRSNRTRVEIGFALAAALLMRADRAKATLTYDAADSSVTIYDTPNAGTVVTGASGSKETLTSTGKLATTLDNTQGVASQTFSPTSTFPATPSYQFSTTDTMPKVGSTTGTSVAKASVEEITNSNTAAVKIQSGTGITQSNPNNQYAASSDLIIYVDEYWTVGSRTGPGMTGLASFVVGGTVGINGSASFSGHFDFYDLSDEESEVTPNTIGGEGSIGSIDFPLTTFPSSTTKATTFSQTFSQSVLLFDPADGTPGYLPAGAVLEMVGYIDFTAKNDDSPTDISLLDVGGVGAGAVPEPASMLLATMGIGSAGLSLLRRRRV